MHIAILTESRYENPSEVNPYIENILMEDSLVAEALIKHGFQVSRLDWARKGIDWQAFDFTLFRSTWDYFDRFEEFDQWLNESKTKTSFINPFEQIKWNLDKHYLLDLESKGVKIPATLTLKKGIKESLEHIFVQSGWKEAILKPMISGGARHTYRLNPKNIFNHESLFKELILKEDYMLQEFQPQIMHKGEISMMVFGGKYSHSILKIAKKGDFRVQDDFGGTVHEYVPNPEEIEFAENVTRLCNTMPIYARVDVTWDEFQKPILMELELIEPELWFRFNSESAIQFAEAVAQHINRRIP